MIKIISFERFNSLHAKTMGFNPEEGVYKCVYEEDGVRKEKIFSANSSEYKIFLEKYLPILDKKIDNLKTQVRKEKNKYSFLDELTLLLGGSAFMLILLYFFVRSGLYFAGSLVTLLGAATSFTISEQYKRTLYDLRYEHMMDQKNELLGHLDKSKSNLKTNSLQNNRVEPLKKVEKQVSESNIRQSFEEDSFKREIESEIYWYLTASEKKKLKVFALTRKGRTSNFMPDSSSYEQFIMKVEQALCELSLNDDKFKNIIFHNGNIMIDGQVVKIDKKFLRNQIFSNPYFKKFLEKKINKSNDISLGGRKR